MPSHGLASVSSIPSSSSWINHEIDPWCDQRELELPEVSRASLADFFAHADGRQALQSACSFGFAPTVG